jgi:hypothetical protein
MAITESYAIGPQRIAWALKTCLEKERKEEAIKRAGRLHIIHLNAVGTPP